MRAGAFWVWTEEGWDDVEDEPAWIGVGHATSEPGAAVLVVATILGWLAARRGDRARGLGRAATVLAGLLLLAYLVAVRAMTTKPE
jgi:heme A synthase